MRNKRRQRHIYVCRDRRRADPAWAADREMLIDVLCLTFPIAMRLEHRATVREIVRANP
jgi:hypothetical protein